MKRRTKLFLGILYAALLLHLPAVTGGFVWDDRQMILENEGIESLGNVPSFFRTNYFGRQGNVELFRPLVNTSLALDHRIWGSWGAEEGERAGPTGFRITNLLLHLLAGTLLYALLRRITDRPFVPEMGACLFLVHPASAEPVAWIVGRGDLLALVFTLATVHLHLSGRRRPWLHLLAPLAYLMGLFSKLVAGPAPLLIFLVEHFFRGLRLREALRPRVLWRYAVYLAPLVVYGIVRARAMGSLTPHHTGVTWRDPALLPAVGVGAAILLRYAALFLVPVGMCADYSSDPVFLVSRLPDLASRLPVILAAAGTAALLGAAFLSRRRATWLSFGLFWFLAGLLPVSQLVPIGSVMADRFLYLPAAGACAALGAGIVSLPRFRLSLGLAAVACLACVTVAREAVWRDDLTMSEDVLRARSYPENADAWNRRGLALDRRGDEAGAEDAFREAVRLDPGNRFALKNLGATLLVRGDLVGARRMLSRALTVAQPRDGQRAKIAYNLSLVSTAEARTAREVLRPWPLVAGLSPFSSVPGILTRRLAGEVLSWGKAWEAARLLQECAIPCASVPVLAYARLGLLFRGRLRLPARARMWEDRAARGR